MSVLMFVIFSFNLLFEIVYRLLVAVRFLHHPTGPLSCCVIKALSIQSYSTAHAKSYLKLSLSPPFLVQRVTTPWSREPLCAAVLLYCAV